MTERWMDELTKQERLDSVFMNFCRELATLSHCCRNQVGSVITNENRVVATGYNGAPAGFENCDSHFAPRIAELEREVMDKRAKFTAEDLMKKQPTVRQEVLESEVFKAEHGEWSKREIHAEMNAILQAAKVGTKIEGGTLYVSISPCMDCAKAIIVSGISRVVYGKEYERDPSGLYFLREAPHLRVEKFSGQLSAWLNTQLSPGETI